MSMFLNVEELIDFIGFQRPKKQIQWLMSRGYKFDVNGAGQPLVLREHIIEMLGGKKQKKCSTPNLHALNELQKR